MNYKYVYYTMYAINKKNFLNQENFEQYARCVQHQRRHTHTHKQRSYYFIILPSLVRQTNILCYSKLKSKGWYTHKNNVNFLLF